VVVAAVVTVAKALAVVVAVAIRRVTLVFFALKSSLGIRQGSDRVLYA
jgi:hypothetical protein